MSKPAAEWIAKYGVTERDLEVASSFVYGAADMYRDECAEWALAAIIAGERARERKLVLAAAHDQEHARLDDDGARPRSP